MSLLSYFYYCFHNSLFEINEYLIEFWFKINITEAQNVMSVIRKEMYQLVGTREKIREGVMKKMATVLNFLKDEVF